MAITPATLTQHSSYEVLDAIAKGQLGFDHRALRRILEDPAGVSQFAAEEHSKHAVNLENELVALFRYLRTPDAVPFFIEFIRREPLDLPDELTDAIYPVRQAALEPLIKLYEELGEEDGAEIVFLLAAFRIQDDRVLKILLEHLEFDAGDGALCLGLYGDLAAKPALEKLLAELDDAEDSHLRQDIADAIEQLGRPFDTEAPASYDIYEDFPETALPEFDLLSEEERLEFLGSPDPEYRSGCASSFRQDELPDKVRNALFERAKSDPEPSVRAACWEALGTEYERKEIREAMIARLQDASVPAIERAGALLGLASDADKPPMRRYTEEFYANEETRAAALQAMWRSLDRSFAPLFPKHLDDENHEIREQAIIGSGYLAVAESAPKLRDLLQDDEVRADALFAYALCVQAEITKGRVRPLLRKIEDEAGGFSDSEEELVQVALDERLLLNGQPPVFFPDRHPQDVAQPKVGRNDPCPCGSGKKYKKCCGAAA